MTDKVQKIREEVEKLHGNPYYMMAVKDVLEILDMQDEPVCKRFAFKAIPRLLDMIKPTDRAKAYIEKLADTLEVEGYSTDAEIVRESLKIMNGEKVPMATMDEEPVSEELEKASKEWLRPQLNKSYANYGETKMMELTRFDGYAMLDAIEYGMRLKKKEMQSIIELVEDHAILTGMNKMEQQMMAKAIDATVHIDAGGYPYIPQMELYDYKKDVPLAKEGDKYKVVLIKEG